VVDFITRIDLKGAAMTKIKSVVKRDGSIVDFTPHRITNAIYRAAVAVSGRDKRAAELLGKKVCHFL